MVCLLCCVVVLLKDARSFVMSETIVNTGVKMFSCCTVSNKASLGRFGTFTSLDTVVQHLSQSRSRLILNNRICIWPSGVVTVSLHHICSRIQDVKVAAQGRTEPHILITEEINGSDAATAVAEARGQGLVTSSLSLCLSLSLSQGCESGACHPWVSLSRVFAQLQSNWMLVPEEHHNCLYQICSPHETCPLKLKLKPCESLTRTSMSDVS